MKEKLTPNRPTLCQCYRHSTASIMRGTPGTRCFRKATMVVHSPLGDIFACDYCTKELTKYECNVVTEQLKD